MMSYQAEERMKKIILWKSCSISITLFLSWLYLESIEEASLFTIMLHATLMMSHYLFGLWWEKKSKNNI